ncbi:putative nuclear envelope pore membrane protein POM 121B [Petaurus breviceps papuanus]|uniref:putative nuclear envelope pore membrane protein POM 121B n=1 Tax=Petaurus breviceps papuanus TaxID=3040969 RepID=UPI0036DBAAD7
MAELQPLANELTCSICLEIFRQPVTSPCGHNFCLPCLDQAWTVQGPSFSCPQCRACFPERPQLKKNTVLCAVVEQLQQAQSRWDLGQSLCASQDGEPSREGGQRKDEAAGSVACDYCLQAPAAKTCFTCMASYCQEHLRPHLDNPTFQGHELQPPVLDLERRKCPEHSRLREFFCSQHGVCICSICLVGHKTCSPVALDVARTQLKKTAARKRELLQRVYEEMKALIESEERSSLLKLKEEEKRVLDKYDHVHHVLLKKKREIESLKEEFELLLKENDAIVFLEEVSKLVTKSVCLPKSKLKEEVMEDVFQNALSLKEILKHTIRNLQEKKIEEVTSPEGDKPQQKPLRDQQEKSGVTEEKTTSSSPAAPQISSTNPLLDSVEKIQNSPRPPVLTDLAGVSAGVPSLLKHTSPSAATGLSEPGLPAATSASSTPFPASFVLAPPSTLTISPTTQTSSAPELDDSTKPPLTASIEPSILFGMLSNPLLASSAPILAAASTPPSTPMFKSIWGSSPKMESRASLPAAPSARASVSCGSILAKAPCTSTPTFKPIFGSMVPCTSVSVASASPFLKQPSSVTPTTAVSTAVQEALFSVLPIIQSPAAPVSAATPSSSGTTDSGSKTTFGFALSSLSSSMASALLTTTSTLSQPVNKPTATTTATTAVMTTTSFHSMFSCPGWATPKPAFSQPTFSSAAQPAFGRVKPLTSFVSTNSVFSFGTTTTSSFAPTPQITSIFTSSSVFGSSTPASFTFGSSTPTDSTGGFGTTISGTRSSMFGSTTPTAFTLASSTPADSNGGFVATKQTTSSGTSSFMFGSKTLAAFTLGSSTPADSNRDSSRGFVSTTQTTSSGTSSFVFGSTTPATFTLGSSTPADSSRGFAFTTQTTTSSGTSSSMFGSTTPAAFTLGSSTPADSSGD